MALTICSPASPPHSFKSSCHCSRFRHLFAALTRHAKVLLRTHEWTTRHVHRVEGKLERSSGCLPVKSIGIYLFWGRVGT